MRILHLTAVNCVSCERCQVESISPLFMAASTETGLGIHARPAAKLSALAKTFESDIKIRRYNRYVSCKNIMGIMMLNITPGRVFMLELSGPDEESAAMQISALLRHGFGEPLCPDFETFLEQAYSADVASDSLNRSPSNELEQFAASLKIAGRCTRGVPCK